MRGPTLISSICVICVICGSNSLSAADPGPWATYRGNPQRTGNTDGKPGPTAPTVLWTIRSQDHYVASPVAVGDRVMLSGLGGFNRPTISLFPFTAAGPKVEPAWSKSAPYL